MKKTFAAVAVAVSLFVGGTAFANSGGYRALFSADVQHGRNHENIQVVQVPGADTANNSVRCVVVSEIGDGYGTGAGVAVSCDWP